VKARNVFDKALRSKPLLLILILLALFIPFVFTSRYHLHLVIMAEIYIILIVALNLCVGFSGLTLLCFPAAFAIGSYASALLTLKLGAPFLVGVAGACAFAGLFGIGVGLVTHRLPQKPYVLATLAINFIVLTAANNWIEVTNGQMGITGIPYASVGNIVFDDRFSYFYLAWTFMAVTIFLIQLTADSRVGRAFLAIREDPLVAETLGVNTLKYKTLAMGLSSLFAGIAGSLYAHYISYISPDLMSMYFLNNFLAMVFVGGATIFGSILGAIIFTFVPEFLRVASEYRLIAVGVFLILSMLYLPGGIGPYINKKFSQIRTRLDSSRSPKKSK
jgi:branched-chain amino acid transport system permease protein